MLSLLLYGENNAAQGQELGVGLDPAENVKWLESLCAIASQSSAANTRSDVVVHDFTVGMNDHAIIFI